MMDLKLIASLGSYSAIIAACIAGIFAASSAIAKNRNEKLKSARQLLLYLLEIRSSIRANLIRPEEVLKQYWEYYFNYLHEKGISISSEDQNLINNFPINPIKEISELFSHSIDDEFIKNYNLLLQGFAKDDPVLAWRIKGEELTERLIRLKDEHMDKLTEISNSAKLDVNLMTSIKSSTNTLVHKEIIENFDSLLIQLAERCGRKTKKECLEITKINDTKIDFVKLGFNKYFDQIISEISATKQ